MKTNMFWKFIILAATLLLTACGGSLHEPETPQTGDADECEKRADKSREGEESRGDCYRREHIASQETLAAVVKLNLKLSQGQASASKPPTLDVSEQPAVASEQFLIGQYLPLDRSRRHLYDRGNMLWLRNRINGYLQIVPNVDSQGVPNLEPNSGAQDTSVWVRAEGYDHPVKMTPLTGLAESVFLGDDNLCYTVRVFKARASAVVDPRDPGSFMRAIPTTLEKDDDRSPKVFGDCVPSLPAPNNLVGWPRIVNDYGIHS